MWIKLCGVQKIDRVKQLVELNIDALGINRYEPSSRYVERSQGVKLSEVIRKNASGVDIVGVYVNPAMEDLKKDHLKIDWDIVQLHGDETPEFCSEISQRTDVIKAFSVDSDFSESRIIPYDCWAYLLDAYDPDAYGGTGKTIKWDSVRKVFENRRVVLSGGLTPDNVNDAINTTNPFGVDVCSGIEDSSGLKDVESSKTFVRQAIGNNCNT